MSTLSDFGLDRRLIPRKTVESLTYIYFEKDNRGIVLDISEGGLRFRVLSAIQETQPVHFWFSAEGQRFEADGEVKWMDEKKVTGGLRFNFLSLEKLDGTNSEVDESAESSPGHGRRDSYTEAPIRCFSSPGKASFRRAEHESAGIRSICIRGMLFGLASVLRGLVAIAILIRVDRSHFGREMLIGNWPALGGKTRGASGSSGASAGRSSRSTPFFAAERNQRCETTGDGVSRTRAGRHCGSFSGDLAANDGYSAQS